MLVKNDIYQGENLGAIQCTFWTEKWLKYPTLRKKWEIDKKDNQKDKDFKEMTYN